jgi:hypothetical protein
MIDSIKGEFGRYKALAEGAMAQLSDDALVREGPGGGNSIAVICWHVSGNLRSRFTDFRPPTAKNPGGRGMRSSPSAGCRAKSCG